RPAGAELHQYGATAGEEAGPAPAPGGDDAMTSTDGRALASHCRRVAGPQRRLWGRVSKNLPILLANLHQGSISTFLASVSQAFLPSKKACGIHTFRHL